MKRLSLPASALGLPRNRVVGIAGLVAILLIAGAVTVLSTLSLGTHTYVALLTQTAGLRPGEAVVVAGVDSGEIKSTAVDNGHVRVVFTLNDSIHLGDQSTAEVQVATLLGTHDLAIHPRGTGDLANNTIPLDRTAVPYNLQDVMDQGTNQLQQLDTKKLAAAFASITDVLRASGHNVDPALRGINRLSTVMINRNDDFKAILSGTKAVTDQLAGSTNDLLSLMQTSNQFLGELNQRRVILDRLLSQVQDLATTVAGLIHDNNAKLTPVLADLNQVLTVLRQRDSEIKSALHTVAVSGRYLANASGNGPWVDLNIPDPGGDANYCLTSGKC